MTLTVKEMVAKTWQTAEAHGRAAALEEAAALVFAVCGNYRNLPALIRGLADAEAK